MSLERTDELARMNAPYGKELVIQTITYEGGMQLLRLRIKEGKRFTMLDLDPDTAAKLSAVMSDWQEQQ
jgi:hypothetical protein